MKEEEKKEPRTLVCSSRVDIRDFAEIVEYFSKNGISTSNKSTIVYKALALLAQILRDRTPRLSTQEAEEKVRKLNLSTKGDNKVQFARIAQKKQEALQYAVSEETNFISPDVEERATEIIQELDKSGIPKQYQTNKNKEK